MDLTRREIKFQIPARLVEPICDYLRAYCEMDKHSRIAPDGYYTINSLYLDNESMVLLENKRQNKPRRFSMRIRSYGKNPDFPAFMEIKRRSDQFIQKQRAPITNWKTLDFMQGLCGPSDTPDSGHPFMEKACFQIVRLGLRPRIMTQYKRMAFFGLYEPYSRVTFDKHLRCYPEEQYQIFPSERKFMNYDHNEQFVSDQPHVVLELKTELKVPDWMKDLIGRFQLRQSQFSKFESSWNFLEDIEAPVSRVPFLPSMRW